MLPDHGLPLWRLPLYVLLHSARLLGYAPWLLMALCRWPKRTAASAMLYYSVRFNSPTWCEAVRRLVAAGSSKRPRLIRAQTRPYDSRKQYLLASHPHGILNYGWCVSS
jgi:hypothetical protein